MTLDQTANTIFDAAMQNGVPLTLDVCESIARKLILPEVQLELPLERGFYAHHRRERYDGEDFPVADL